MEQKKTAWNNNTLRAFFNHWKFGSNFFWRKPFANLLESAGFTLIELLVTIGLIGVLAGGVVTILNPLGQIQKARDASRKSDLTQIKNALEVYYHDNGNYPPSAPLPDYRILDLNNNPVPWGGSWQPYMSILPKDPTSSKTYVYVNVSTDPETYFLYASLDKTDDPQACNGGAVCGNVPAGVTCGTATDICNYGVSSSNASP